MALQATWFFLWGLLWAIFFITDGFDFGFFGLTDGIGRLLGEIFTAVQAHDISRSTVDRIPAQKVPRL